LFPDGPRFGGAPANFACHAASLGARALMVGGVGDDRLGRRALDALRSLGVDTRYVTVDPRAATGTVDDTLDQAGKASIQFASDAAWDRLEWNDGLAELAAVVDAVCFGTLGQREQPSRATIQRLVAATPDSALRVFDVNLRPPFYDRDVIEQSLAIAGAGYGLEAERR
jgi:fructokinase